MGDPGKFSTLTQYYLFMIALFTSVIMEVTLLTATTVRKSKGDKIKVSKRDRGTKWLLIACYMASIYFSFFMVSQQVPVSVRSMVLPQWTAWIGILLMGAGMVIRLIAIITLNRAFTYNVQTTDSQHLITSGIYHLVRNPAYTGSIITLIGVAASLRSVIAIVGVVALSLLCYALRIHTEEKALEGQFKDEYIQYESKTYRLFPYIW